MYTCGLCSTSAAAAVVNAVSAASTAGILARSTRSSVIASAEPGSSATTSAWKPSASESKIAGMAALGSVKTLNAS